MESKKKLSVEEKEKRILDRIEKAKKSLNQLQEKRRNDLGRLACKHNLDRISDTVLDQAFARLSRELTHEHA